jgi:uncharacterized protein YndB with AHSA1/START domain
MARRAEAPKLAHAGAVELTRVFDAPRALVFAAWTEPQHINQWWGPKPFTSRDARVDLRVGGAWCFVMTSPDGQDFWCGGTFLEIEAPARLVYTNHFTDAHGAPVPPSRYGMPGDTPEEMLCTVTFEELPGGKTRLALRHEGIPEAMMGNTEAGWSTSLDKLVDVVHALRT